MKVAGNNKVDKSQGKGGGTRIVDTYLMSLDRQSVELHIAYGNTVLKMEGTIKSKARYDVILEFTDDDGNLQKLVINKAYIVMARPLPNLKNQSSQ